MSRKVKPESEKKIAVAARFAPPLMEQVQAIAKADERTISYLIEKAMREYVERRKKSGK